MTGVAVHITRVYTRTGDDGTTALGDMSRTRKTSPRLAAYADVDETNAVLGLVTSLGDPGDDVAEVMRQVSNDLFDVGADLCTPFAEDPPHPPLRVHTGYVERLEGWCDTFNAPLEKLSSFVLPGGTPAAALLHQARTVARRAERSVWALVEAEPDARAELPAQYLNRLSDLLFILARVANRGDDVLWRPGGGR